MDSVLPAGGAQAFWLRTPGCGEIRPATLPAPLGLLAELTHRCPLGCPYCSNPLELDKRADELDTATWARVFREAAGLGSLLNMRGLICLIVLNIGLDLKIFNTVIFSMMVVMALVNTLLTLPMFDFFCPRKMFQQASGGKTREPALVPALDLSDVSAG